MKCMKFLFIVVASVFIAFAISDGELPLAKIEEKTRDKYVCRGQMISLNAEMARVANVERGNIKDHEQYSPLPFA